MSISAISTPVADPAALQQLQRQAAAQGQGGAPGNGGPVSNAPDPATPPPPPATTSAGLLDTFA